MIIKSTIWAVMLGSLGLGCASALEKAFPADAYEVLFDCEIVEAKESGNVFVVSRLIYNTGNPLGAKFPCITKIVTPITEGKIVEVELPSLYLTEEAFGAQKRIIEERVRKYGGNTPKIFPSSK